MAIPRVFVSSTCYDLKYIRENLKYFIKEIGYDPVLSDDGDVYYNPAIHTHDACLHEMETCQIFVLIIGGRYGGKFKDSDHSITNHEYRVAVSKKIPIFALIETAVYSDHHVYLTNKKIDPDISEKIKYPSVDNIRVFDFVDEVRRQVDNNAIFAFRDFSDMEVYLKKQWAGMMYDFLTRKAYDEQSRVTNKLLDDLSLATRKSEELIKILLKTSGADGVDEKIFEADNMVQAEGFFRSVFSNFGINKIADGVEDLMSIPLDGNWVDFLEKTSQFHIDEIYYDDEDRGCTIDIVLFGPKGGLQVGTKEVGDDCYCWTEFDRGFNALKNLDSEARVEVYKKAVAGF